MRTLSAGLTAAQAVRSPKITITATVANRGLSPGLPALNWSELKAPSGTEPLYPSAGCYMTTANRILRFKSTAAAIQIQVMDPANPSADDWHVSNGWTTIYSYAADAMHAHANTATAARIYWIDSGNIYYGRTTDSGTTWLARQTYYSGGDAALDVVSVATTGHTLNNNCVGYTTLNAGTYAAYFDGGSGAVKYADHWRAAGIFYDPADTTYIYPLVFRASGRGQARLRRLRFDGAAFDETENIDQTQAGLLGLDLAAVKYYGFGRLTSQGALIAIEQAYSGGVYEGLGSVFDAGETYLSDEPLIFPNIDTYNDRVYSAAVYDGTNAYYFNSIAVYKGTPPSATAETLRPVAYTYADNAIEITLGQTTPSVHPGQLLTLRRTLSWGTDTGYEDLLFYVTSFRRSKSNVTITGLDALGLLALTRPRRPNIANNTSANNLTAILRRLAARAGIPLSSDHSSIDTLAALPLTLQPSESLLGAAYRATSQANAWLVPNNTPTFALTAITPGTSDSGDYDDTPHTYPDGQWTLIDATEISDMRHLAFSYVLGTYSTDPEDGSYVAMSAGPVVDNTRPIPYSITNYRYNTYTRVTNAAAAEANRQDYLPIHAVIQIPADLSLELYDVVEVTAQHLDWTSETFRVRRILERFDRGRLTQTISLGRDP